MSAHNKRIVKTSLSFSFLFFASQLAFSQSLIGDQVTASRIITSIGFLRGPITKTVQVGTGDRLSLSTGSNFFVDFEESSIHIDFGGGGSGGDFALTDHYAIFESLNFGGNYEISGLTYSTTTPGLSGQNIAFGPDFVRFNYGGQMIASGTYLDIYIQTSSPIPEPASWILALAGGSIILSARFINKKYRHKY
jgi:hypothetical protein